MRQVFVAIDWSPVLSRSRVWGRWEAGVVGWWWWWWCGGVGCWCWRERVCCQLRWRQHEKPMQIAQSVIVCGSQHEGQRDLSRSTTGTHIFTEEHGTHRTVAPVEHRNTQEQRLPWYHGTSTMTVAWYGSIPRNSPSCTQRVREQDSGQPVGERSECRATRT
jgi:hypothetical protein